MKFIVEMQNSERREVEADNLETAIRTSPYSVHAVYPADSGKRNIAFVLRNGYVVHPGCYYRYTKAFDPENKPPIERFLVSGAEVAILTRDQTCRQCGKPFTTTCTSKTSKP
jgi:hypothetical protein